MISVRRIPWLLAAALFAAYAALSVARHRQLQTTGYDLGIFEQAVRAYAEGRAPVSLLKGPDFHLLGDHFHPILVLLAPAYRLFPGPITLLVAQAVLIALSAVPVTRLAIDRLGRWPGACVGVAYGLSWGIQQAVSFDFHEVAFAVPLLACSVGMLARRRWRAAVLWALPLLLVKEDLAVTVALIGGYVWWSGRRALGAAVVAGAVLAGALTVGVLIPAFNPEGGYGYGGAARLDGGNPLGRLVLPGTKWWTVACLGAPTLFVALRSPIAVLVLPTLAWRFWAATPAYWGTGFHYSAVLMPILFVAMVDGLARLGAARPGGAGTGRQPVRDWRHLVLRLAPPAAALLALALTAVGQPLRDLTTEPVWRLPAESVAGRAALAAIPDGARVAAANKLAPQLTGRCPVSLFPPIRPPAGGLPEWVAVLDDPGDFPVPAADQRAAAAALGGAGYTRVAAGGGVTVYRAAPPGGTAPGAGRSLR